VNIAVDAHQHYWDVSRADYGWQRQGLPSLDRDYLPDELEPQLLDVGITSTILVQVLNSLDETTWMLRLAGSRPGVAGVVGWVDLVQAPEQIKDDLERLRTNRRFVGIRHLVHEEPDDDWLVREDVLRGLAVVADLGLPFDLLLRPQHLSHIPRLSSRVPALRMVIDHIAKPSIRDRVIEPWASEIAVAAENPNVWCKLSGMITEARHDSWVAEDLAPYVDVALRAFGVERLMFGSDWPVCTLAGSYRQVFEALTIVLGQSDRPVNEHVFGASAATFYGLSLPDQQFRIS